MKKTLFLIIGLIILSFGISSAQKIKFKKKKVYVDGEILLEYTSDFSGTSFKNLDGKELFFVSSRLETDVTPAHIKVVFPDFKKIMTNHTSFITSKTIIRSLLANKALENGTLNEGGVDSFILKYHEEIPTTQKVVIEETD